MIAGNWKLQIVKRENAEQTFAKIEKVAKAHSSVETVLAIPSEFLFVIKGEQCGKASQNVHYAKKGAFTGESSIVTVIDAGCAYTLIGHSERRFIFHESDEEINKKVLLTTKTKLHTILCIGETAKEREDGQQKKILYQQLSEALKGIPTESLEQISIAYEPVWAINNPILNPTGKIKPASPELAQETHRLIRNWIRKKHEEIADSIRIVYGGSITNKNAKNFLIQPDIDGCLVGTASTDSQNFGEIITIAAKLS